MIKSQTTPINIFLLTFLFRKIYILLENVFRKTCFLLLRLYYSFFAWQSIGNVIIKYQPPYRYALVLQTPYFDLKYLAMTRYFNVDFDSNGSFLFLFISGKHLQFDKKPKAFVKEKFWFTSSNQIYLLRNCFSNHVHLKDKYITLKGTGKILFVSVLRILIICISLNFTTVFTKKSLNFPEFAYRFPSETVNTIHSFCRTLLSSQVLPVISKSYIRINIKK